MKILDLYSGMGGLSLGFLMAIDDAETLGLDIDRDAVATYNLNLSRRGGKAIIQDVLKWTPHGEYDAVIGGTPCQPFSIANNKKPNKSHPLFPTFSRFFDIVLTIEPDLFLLENVKGLLMKRNRHFLEEQLKRLEDKYITKYMVLNATYYGVPQRRERVFVFGIRRDLGIQPSFPQKTHTESNWVTLREAIGDLMMIPPTPDIIFRPEQVERIRRERLNIRGIHWGTKEFPDNLDKPARTLSSHTIEGTKRETFVIPTEHVMTREGGWDNPRSDWGSRIMRIDNPAYTITEKHRSGQLVENIYRRITVREALRIQSFPDWWRFPESISKSKKYKLVGEAVPPILAYKLVIHIAKLMNWKTRQPPKPEEWNIPYFKRAFTIP
jgi:DNA (cytosine-5)-methyltransferase 1